MDIYQYTNKFNMVYNKQLFNNLSSSLSEIINSNYKYSTNKSYFFSSQLVIGVDNYNDKLRVIVEPNNLKKLYLSYQTLNNRFGEAPDESLLDLNNYTKYRFSFVINKNGNIDITPYIIHYKNGDKRKLSRVDKTNQIIDFSDDNQCRLTFKITGHGMFTINEIIIIPEG